MTVAPTVAPIAALALVVVPLGTTSRPTTCGKKTIHAVAEGEVQASGPSAVVRVKCERGMVR